MICVMSGGAESFSYTEFRNKTPYRTNPVDYAQKEVKHGKINRSVYGRWCSKR